MKQITSFGQERISRLLFRYSAPAIAGFLVYGLNRMVGNVFIGKFLGPAALSGYTVANSVVMVLLACTMLVGTGAAAVISLRLGAKRLEDARRVLGTAYLMALGGGLALALAGWLLLEPMLVLFGARGAVLAEAASFTRIFLAGCSFQILNTVLNSAIRAEGKPLKAFSTNLISFGFNAVLTPVCMLGLGLGMAGVGLASLLASFIMSVWLTGHFRGASTVLGLRLRDLRWNPDDARALLKIGVAPASLQALAALLSILTNHIAMANGGESSVAVLGVVFTTYFLLIMPLQGTGTGIQPILGYNHGAGLHRRVGQTVTAALAFTAAICVAEFGLVVLFRESLPSLFLSGQPDIRATSARGLLLVLLAFPVAGIQFVGSSFFQSTGKAGRAIFINLFRSLFIVAPLLALPAFWGLDGMFLSYPLTELVVAAIVGLMLAADLRRTRSLAAGAAANAAGRAEPTPSN
jgi:putative MATE family efflux protein